MLELIWWPQLLFLVLRMEEDLESLTAAAKETSIASQAYALRQKFDEGDRRKISWNRSDVTDKRCSMKHTRRVP